MSASIPEVLPAHEDSVPVLEEHTAPGKSLLAGFVRLIRTVFGWGWRIIAGSWLCFNLAYLSFFTSVAVAGWLLRFMRGRVLYGLWKQSPRMHDTSFTEFADSLGIEAPSLRPRLFWQEQVRAHLDRPAPNGTPPGPFRIMLRMLKIPWAGFWLNFRLGLQCLIATWSVTGWGCLIMLFSWEFGWLNSFNKGYEQAFVGPITGWLGLVLFLLSMFYVPMAQTHLAATGDLRAFFDFRFVWRLIQACPWRYAFASMFLSVSAILMQILKTLPVGFDDHMPQLLDATDQEFHHYLKGYLSGCAYGLIIALILTRLLAALVYRRALLRVLTQGMVPREQWHPRLAGVLEDLGHTFPTAAVVPPARVGTLRWWTLGSVDVAVTAATLAIMIVAGGGGLLILLLWLAFWVIQVPFRGFWRGAMARYMSGFRYRMLFVLLFWAWFVYIGSVYVCEFLNYHPILGFTNHPLIQLPCFDYMPANLVQTVGP